MEYHTYPDLEGTCSLSDFAFIFLPLMRFVALRNMVLLFTKTEASLKPFHVSQLKGNKLQICEKMILKLEINSPGHKQYRHRPCLQINTQSKHNIRQLHTEIDYCW